MICSAETLLVRRGNPNKRERRKEPLRQTVSSCLDRYFADMKGHAPVGIYQMVLEQVEPGLLETVMHHAEGNQTRAAEMLGINRGTLRKKLKQYGLEP